MSYNCVDHHVETGDGNRAALVYETGERDVTEVLTYRQLLHEVRQVAAMLRGQGVERGDRVTIYMPMCPEAVVSMLACTRIGAIHSVVFGGFGAGALADRIELAEPELLLTADVGYRKGDTVDLKSIVDRTFEECDSAADLVDTTVVLQRGEEPPQLDSDRDISWADALARGEGEDTSYVEMDANDPAFILPTSGTASSSASGSTRSRTRSAARSRSVPSTGSRHASTPRSNRSACRSSTTTSRWRTSYSARTIGSAASSTSVTSPIQRSSVISLSRPHA